MGTYHLLRRLVLLTLLVAACEHTTPFQPGKYGPNGPLVPGSPTRFTFNQGEDLQPAWLPDGGIVYTAERGDRADHDRCLAFLPEGGGAITRYSCRTTTADDSINTFESAAPGPNGLIAYVHTSTARGLNRLAPDAQQLVTAPIENPTAARVVGSIPLAMPWGRTYTGLADLTWLDSSRLLFVGQNVTYPRCPFCAPDTVRTGVELAVVTITSDAPVFTLVPGTADASSVSAGATGDTIYFTRVGDSLVYRYVFSSAQLDTAYDFGAAGIARDVSVAGSRLTAIVGGAVIDSTDAFLGRLQFDHGGPLYVTTLPGGAAVQLGDASWRLRYPALSASPSRIAVTAWIPPATTADLWLFDVP